jgi:hypothetical protein
MAGCIIREELDGGRESVEALREALASSPHSGRIGGRPERAGTWEMRASAPLTVCTKSAA